MYTWKFSTSDACLFLNLKENRKHQMFECYRVSTLWQKFSNILKATIQWKHLVLGFKSDDLIGRMRYLLISIILNAIHIYNFKVKKENTLNFMFLLKVLCKDVSKY